MAKLAERDEGRRRAEELQLHRAMILAERMPAIWREVKSQLNAEAIRYQKTYGSKIEIDLGEFRSITITKFDYPTVLLKVECCGSGTHVPFTLKKRQFSDAEPREIDGAISFSVDENNNV